MKTLEEYGWLAKLPLNTVVGGSTRKLAYRIIREAG